MLEVKKTMYTEYATVWLSEGARDEVRLVGEKGSGAVALHLPNGRVVFLTRDALMVFAHDLDGLLKFIGNREG